MEQPFLRPTTDIDRTGLDVLDYLANEGKDAIEVTLRSLDENRTREPEEKIDIHQALFALRCIGEYMLEDTFIDREEVIADKILQKLKTKTQEQKQGMREEAPEFWLMSPTGQFVLAFLRQLTHTRPGELYDQVPPPNSTEMKDKQVLEFIRSFFDVDSCLFKQIVQEADRLSMEIGRMKGFILPTPYPPITQIPRTDILCNQSDGYRFDEVTRFYFLRGVPGSDGRPRIDFAVTPEDYPVYGIQTSEDQDRFVRDIEVANRQRFPICALFDPIKVLKPDRRSGVTIPELSKAVEERGWVFGTIDTALAYGKYAWDASKNPEVFVAGSPFSLPLGPTRIISQLRRPSAGGRRTLDCHSFSLAYSMFYPHLVVLKDPGDHLVAKILKDIKNVSLGKE